MSTIDINGYLFSIQQYANQYQTLFDVTKDGRQFLITRYNESNQSFYLQKLEKEKFFIPYLESFYEKKEGKEIKTTKYLVYAPQENKVTDYLLKLAANKKEQFARHIIRSLYAIYKLLAQENIFIRFKLESLYLKFHTYDTSIRQDFENSDVLVLCDPISFPTPVGTENFMAPEQKEQFKARKDVKELAYQAFVQDFAYIIEFILPGNYMQFEDISFECKDFVSKCLSKELPITFEKLANEKFMNDLNYSQLKRSNVFAGSINNGNNSIKPIFASISPNKEHKLFPLLKPVRMIEVAHCYSFYKTIDKEVNEKTKKTFKDEAFEAADSLFNKMTFKADLKPVLFPLYDTLIDDYEQFKKKESGAASVKK